MFHHMGIGRREAEMVKRIVLALAIAGSLGVAAVAGWIWVDHGWYGFHVVLRHGGTWWARVRTDDPRLSPAIRLALADPPPTHPGSFAWRAIAPGFEVGALPVIAGGAEVDRIELARVDPARFRFVVRNAPSGDKNLDEWMTETGAALIVNGSYYAHDGTPDTPFVSAGTRLGPAQYDAKAGAFVALPDFVGIRDLAHEDWRAAFAGAEDAMVSYPLLVAADGTSRVARPSRWLANRSFVGQDGEGRIIIGTTEDAYFSLDRLAAFLRQAPLGLTLALNLDGGPVACQGIALGGFQRRTYGKWEMEVEGDKAELLTWPYGTVAMPVVLAVFPR
jgi:hypothetical protein